jgi:DNA-binding NtrC family response regulator
MKSKAEKKKSILIVEDDRDQLSRYFIMARKAGLDVLGASNYEEAFQTLKKRTFDYCLSDIHLSGDLNQDGFEGLQLLDFIRQNMPEVTTIAMTADPKISTYHKVQAKGVSHLFRKPIRTEDELLLYLELARKDRQKSGSLGKRGTKRSQIPPHILAQHPDGVVMPPEVRELARLVAIDGEAPFVISGETGTGKEELAKAVHRLSIEVRGPMPFVAVNCANIGGEVAVSTLFGHKKGAFTGAEFTVNGLIGDANGGILFLDEINTLSLECQQRLLRVLNDGSYQRLGDSQTLYSQFQVIAAANCDLYEEVEKGKFLLDLVSRLTGLAITLKPLRERKEDLPILVELALAKFGAKISQEEIARLADYCGQFYWRGNIRELFQVIRAMVILAGGDESKITAENLPVLPGMLPPGTKVKSDAKECHQKELRYFKNALETDMPLTESLEEIERMLIQSALDRHKSVREAAAALSTPLSTFKSRIQKLNIK